MERAPQVPTALRWESGGLFLRYMERAPQVPTVLRWEPGGLFCVIWIDSAPPVPIAVRELRWEPGGALLRYVSSGLNLKEAPRVPTAECLILLWGPGGLFCVWMRA